jgi:TonB family protein
MGVHFPTFSFCYVAGATAKRVTTAHGSGDLPDEVIDYQWPSYPYLARYERLDGEGHFRLRIDPATGNVSAVDVVKTTTHKILDDAAVTAFRKWHFKAHTIKEVEVPVTFRYNQKPVSEARRLAIYAPAPEQPVTYHTGIGTFRFIIDYDTGKVIDVKIIKSTGRISFDQAVVKAYRQWRFLPHKARSIDTTVGFTP